MIAAAITARAGSSAVFERGFVTYSNESKQEMLGVPALLIAEFGAVSAECAQAMATGALANSSADLAVSVTGIAGPDGGSKIKPVGTVHIGYAVRDGSTGSSAYHFEGSRDDVRRQSCEAALSTSINALKELENG